MNLSEKFNQTFEPELLQAIDAKAKFISAKEGDVIKIGEVVATVNSDVAAPQAKSAVNDPHIPHRCACRWRFVRSLVCRSLKTCSPVNLTS